MGFISELFDEIKGIIAMILGVGLVLEVIAPGFAASLLIFVGFLMLLFSSKRGLGFLLMVGASLWLYLVDYSIIMKFYDGIGLINIDNIVAEAKLGKKGYRADYVLKADMYTESKNKTKFKKSFKRNEAIKLAIKLDTSKGYTYNRSYPENNLIVYLVHKGKKKKKDPYTPKIPLEDKIGFVYPNDGGYGVNIPGDITFADDYSYLTMNQPRLRKGRYTSAWRIKDADEYLKPGKWELYLFIGLPNSSTSFHTRSIIRRTLIVEDFFDMTSPKFYNNIKRYWDDELAVKLTFKIK